MDIVGYWIERYVLICCCLDCWDPIIFLWDHKSKVNEYLPYYFNLQSDERIMFWHFRVTYEKRPPAWTYISLRWADDEKWELLSLMREAGWSIKTRNNEESCVNYCPTQRLNYLLPYFPDQPSVRSRHKQKTKKWTLCHIQPTNN